MIYFTKLESFTVPRSDYWVYPAKVKYLNKAPDGGTYLILDNETLHVRGDPEEVAEQLEHEDHVRTMTRVAAETRAVKLSETPMKDRVK